MPRVVDCMLSCKVNTQPIMNGSLVVSRAVISQEIWADLRIVFTDDDLRALDPGSVLDGLEQKIKAAFESDVVRNALATEVRRGRLIGGEV